MKRTIIYIISAFFLFVGCDKEKTSDVDEQSKVYLKSIMDEIYYWYRAVPQNVSERNKDVFEYFDALLYSKDRWSWMMTGTKWYESETGEYLSYGASIAQPIDYYDDYSVMIRYVHPGSPFDLKGIKRGWTLTHLGGVEVMKLIEKEKFTEEFAKASNSFTFKDEKGIVHDYDISATTIHTKSYLLKDVFTSEDFAGLQGKVGYFNYLTFNANMLVQLDEAFAEFKKEGVSDFILDLRYNGGGDAEATKLLAEYLAPAASQGEVLVRRKHNDKYSKMDADKTVKIDRRANSLDLARLFVITGSGTASASEIIINGLKPFFGDNLFLVGNTTYGKPNGMYAYPYPTGSDNDYYDAAEYVFLPICFFSVNRDGEGDYMDGIAPTNYRPDDLYHDWGTDEDLIKACLSYISAGSFPALPPSQKTRSSSGAIRIKADEEAPGYGWDIERIL